ncbi:diguanylate cyclase [Sulfurimonas sp. MAG313]|nr:diguanylate cyclase [Sulfurimonas sp. MAG313]MDF1881413.1 diguanylate cyclase [Sulfurimonas sp. MAG313]
MLHSKNSQFILKNFLPFTLSIFLISFISISSIYNLEKVNIEFQSKHNRIQLEKTYDNQLRLYGRMFSGYLDFIAHDKNIIKLYKTKDRQALYDYTKPILDRLQKQYNISHFYFHTLESKVFLRVHDFKRHSDLIDRDTLFQTVKTKTMTAGIELGVYNTLTLRVVIPWIIEGELLGYIELGEDIDYMASSLSEMLNMTHVIIAINMDKLHPSKYNKWLKKRMSDEPSLDAGQFVIIDSTIMNINKKIKAYVNKYMKHENDNFIIKGVSYRVNSISMRDANENIIGKVVLFSAVKEEENAFKNLVARTSILIALISLLILVSYYIYARKIIKIAIKDDMTQLYNRRFFDLNSKKQLKNAIDNDLVFSLLIIDIDNFKLYNDTYGHMKGDDALKHVAKILNDFFNKEKEMVYRIGGEEFAVICKTRKEAALNISRVQALVDLVYSAKIPHTRNENYGYITISVGVVSKNVDEDTSFSKLFIKADANLYKAKEAGRNRLSFSKDYNTPRKSDSFL